MRSIGQKHVGKQAANLSTTSLSALGKQPYEVSLVLTGLLTVDMVVKVE